MKENSLPIYIFFIKLIWHCIKLKSCFNFLIYFYFKKYHNLSTITFKNTLQAYKLIRYKKSCFNIGLTNSKITIRVK